MPVDLAELAADCRTEAEPRACAVRVEGHIADAVVCDQGLIRRALENALRNAIRFSPQGRGDDVTLRESHSSVMVTVQDYGPGRRKALCSASSTPSFASTRRETPIAVGADSVCPLPGGRLPCTGERSRRGMRAQACWSQSSFSAHAQIAQSGGLPRTRRASTDALHRSERDHMVPTDCSLLKINILRKQLAKCCGMLAK